jgi:hypothetical protein
MSRFYSNSKCGKYSYTWGFDRPLKEVFFHKYDYLDDKNHGDCHFAIANISTLTIHPDHPDKLSYTNNEILNIMEKESNDHGLEIPSDHLLAIYVNWPF